VKFLTKTYGCQMNERDTDAVRALLVARGHEPVDSEAAAELIIVNTCSVRGKAEAKALGKLGLLAAGKHRFPGRIVGAMGCMVQRYGMRLFEKVPGVDFGIGTYRLQGLPAVVDRVLAGEGPVLEAGTAREGLEALSAHADPGPTAFVNILLGCNRRCTYCVVPAVRGNEWSRPAANVLKEVRSLAENGTREITLLGQSVMSYGRGNPVFPDASVSPGGYTEALPRLLEAVDAVPGIERVRFTSGHPSGCTSELARAMATLPTVCEHLHLPVQSGSDRVLKRMRRGYDTQAYRAAVQRLRDAVPEMALTTDIIVGFPGETDEDFAATRAFLAEMGFDNAFIFKYSPRPDTPAAEWEDDVPDAEKRRRNQVLLADLDVRASRKHAALANRVFPVLVEGPSRRNPDRWAGRTRTHKIVVFERRPETQPGDMVDVRITSTGPQTLYGEIV